MKKYIFVIRLADCKSPHIYEDFECDADAMKQARETLREWKKEHDVLQIDVYSAKRVDLIGKSWVPDRWIISYC